MPDKTKISMGLETEYGFHVSGEDIVDALSRGINHVDAPRAVHGGSFFLGNGSRVYVDGAHPEYATPECADPWTLVAHARAGDRLMNKWFVEQSDWRATPAERHLSRASFQLQMNGGYVDSATTWGSHESYSVESDGRDLWPLLDPHLMSRVVCCAPGSFVPSGWLDGKHTFHTRTPVSSRGKLAFCLSGRLLVKWTNEDNKYQHGEIPEWGEYGCGLIGTKEGHSVESRSVRLHLMCGDSLCSDLSLFIRYASTAILVRIAENTKYISGAYDRIKVDRPIKAMQTWLVNPHAVVCGETAFSVQRKLVAIAKDFLKEPWMPKWAPKAWKIWRDNVELADDPAEATKRFDWALKKALFERMKNPTAGDVLEFDAKFPIVGAGIFHDIDSSNLLKHKIAKEPDIRRAMEYAPEDTRAATRGALIQSLSWEVEDHRRMVADWGYVTVLSAMGEKTLTALMDDPLTPSAMIVKNRYTSEYEDSLLERVSSIEGVRTRVR